jgi:hypothetical protein
MKRLNKIVAVLLLISVGGCASNKPIPNAKIPASLLVQCEPLEQLQGLTGKDMLTNITSNAAIYHRCDDSHKALIDAVKDK